MGFYTCNNCLISLNPFHEVNIFLIIKILKFFVELYLCLGPNDLVLALNFDFGFQEIWKGSTVKVNAAQAEYKKQYNDIAFFIFLKL